MPRLNTSSVAFATGQFSFSGVRPEQLGASEYTLVTLVVDVTASVQPFKDELLAAVRAAVTGCRHSARADNLLLRLITFNTDRQEIHGFKPLADLDPAAYAPFRPDGMTALYDAVYDAVNATRRYARLLVAQDFAVNAVIYTLTDGGDNASKTGPRHIAEELRELKREELLDSVTTVLIGVNTQDATVSRLLQDFKAQAELDQYLDAGAATPERLAKLAAFVSRSIGLHSQALGSGSAPATARF